MSKDGAGAEALQERVQLQVQLSQWMAVVIVRQNLASQIIHMMHMHRCVHAYLHTYLHRCLHRYIKIDE